MQDEPTDAACGRDRRGRGRQPDRAPPGPHRPPSRHAARRRPGRPRRCTARGAPRSAPPTSSTCSTSPAGGMSALPEDPGHFVAWRARQHPELMTEPGVFAPRVEWARYLDETLTQRLRAATSRSGSATCACARPASVATAPAWSSPPTTGRCVVGDAVVLATGEQPPGVALGTRGAAALAVLRPRPVGARAPSTSYAATRSGPADVLLVGTGLTMVDVVLSLTGPVAAGPTAVIHAVSRHGRAADARTPTSSSWPRSPRSTTGADASRSYRRRAAEHIARVAARRPATGDRRSTGCATVVQALWQRLDEDDRERVPRAPTPAPGDGVRHRMPPASADVVARAAGSRRR